MPKGGNSLNTAQARSKCASEYGLKTVEIAAVVENAFLAIEIRIIEQLYKDENIEPWRVVECSGQTKKVLNFSFRNP